jgi:hypothetical protein
MSHARDQPGADRVDVLDVLVAYHAAVEVTDDLYVDDDSALLVIGECLRLDARVDGLAFRVQYSRTSS